MFSDVKKMPLGKLSKLQIAKGLEALIDIEDAIKKNKVLERRAIRPISSLSWAAETSLDFYQFVWLYNILMNIRSLF